MSKRFVTMRHCIAILVILSAGHAFASENRAHTVDFGNVVEAMEYGDMFFWQRLGPDAFIDFLKHTRTIYYVHGRHIGWVQKADIPFLAKLVTSQESCAPIVMTISAIAYPEETRSTVGNEALFLIEGFRRGYYPPSITSIGFAKEHGQDTLRWLKKRERQ